VHFHLLVLDGAYRQDVAQDRLQFVPGSAQPRSLLMTRDPSSDVDSGCFEPTGILRDGDGNALGGVRLPDLNVGRATYIASDPDRVFGFPGLLGDSIDLSCAVDEYDRPRFKDHGQYVSAFGHQANALRNAGFLLEDDAEFLKDEADASSVGKPEGCD
jgi:hypothetical protein